MLILNTIKFPLIDLVLYLCAKLAGTKNAPLFDPICNEFRAPNEKKIASGTRLSLVKVEE